MCACAHVDMFDIFMCARARFHSLERQERENIFISTNRQYTHCIAKRRYPRFHRNGTYVFICYQKKYLRFQSTYVLRSYVGVWGITPSYAHLGAVPNLGEWRDWIPPRYKYWGYLRFR